MHFEILDNNRQDILKKISRSISLQDYYMVGGTALSLQTGIRESFDFDFCTPVLFNNQVLLDEVNKIGDVKVLQNQKGTFDILLNDIQVSFFYYPNKVLGNFTLSEEIPDLRLAGIIDITAMKLNAIGGRGAKKDFFDLYHILNFCNISVSDATNALVDKNGKDKNYLNILMGLTYFEDAETQVLPKTFVEYDWEQIKKYFIKIQPVFEACLNDKLTDLNYIASENTEHDKLKNTEPQRKSNNC